MNSRSSQPIVWIIVALLTAALYAGALKWVKFSMPFIEKPDEEITLIDLDFIEFAKPVPEPQPIEEPAPPEPEPLPTPPPTPEPEPMPEPEPIPEQVQPPPPPKVEPTPPPKPKIDPAILRREREAKEARARELQRQRDLAKKRVEEKRRQQMAAQKAAAAKKKAADALAAKKARAAAKARAESKARAAAAKRIASKPSATSRPAPRYPSSARRAGHQGTVTLSFTVGSNGRVSSIRVAKSSGHSSLDNAALSAIRKWRFKPARNGLGQAVSYSYSLPIPFRLQ